MTDETVGDVMTNDRDRALKTIAIGAGVVVYAGMLAYSAVHNWRLLTSGVAPDMRIWAALGVIALEISAAALPVALHWWTHSPLQRLAAFAFYGLDLALIFANVVLDYAINTGESLPAWLAVYLFFVVPGTPILAGLGWSVLFLLDPSQRERALIETLRASTRQALAARVAQAARAADITAEVDQAAGIMAHDIIKQTLGAAVTRTAPAGVIDAVATDPQARRRNPAATWRKPQRAPITYNATAEAEGSEDFLAGSSNGRPSE